MSKQRFTHFTVYLVDVEPRGTFSTFDAAHARAITLIETEGGLVRIRQGDELIWDSLNGYEPKERV